MMKEHSECNCNCGENSCSQEKVLDTEGNEVANPTLKQRIVIAVAEGVYRDEKLLSSAIEYCMKDGNRFTTLEQYVERNLGMLLPKFPDLRDAYVSEVRVKHKKLSRKNKKIRRNK